MTPTKLSDSDKRELIRLYRQSNENTITLAKRYGVSSSTVRRIIQGALSEPEYEFLVQQKQKRLSDRTSVSEPTEATTEPSADGEIDPVGVPLSESVPVQQSASNSTPTIRKRSGSVPEPVAELEIRGNVESDLDVSDVPDAPAANLPDRSHRAVVTGELKAMLPAEGLLAGEDFSDFEEDDEDEDQEDEDDLDDDFDEDLEEEDSLFEGSFLGSLSSGESIELRGTGLIQVLPLSEASLPKI
jgi:transposase-like protein